MYGGQLRKEQARCALPKLAGGWLAGVGLPHSSTVLKEEKFDFFFFLVMDKNSRMNTWKGRGQADSNSSARQGSYHFSAGQNWSPRAMVSGPLHPLQQPHPQVSISRSHPSCPLHSSRTQMTTCLNLDHCLL